MKNRKIVLAPPPLQELAGVLRKALPNNYAEASVDVVQCPNLRHAPFHLPFEGLGGQETIADFGGQWNLYPTPLIEKTYSLADCARQMNLSSQKGALIGAGAAPFASLGINAEMAPCFSWEERLERCINKTRSATVNYSDSEKGQPQCRETHIAERGLMVNLYGSRAMPGEVLRICARQRTGSYGSFTEFLRSAITSEYGKERQISLGGVFLMKGGTARFHIMPDFPKQEQLPFKSPAEIDRWLTYHDFHGPMICFSVLHSADPHDVSIRMEHTHCYSPLKSEGGHYHYDLPNEEGDVDIEYEAYFNTAKTFFQVDYPTAT